MEGYRRGAGMGALILAVVGTSLLSPPVAARVPDRASEPPPPLVSAAPYATDRVLLLPRADTDPAALRRTADRLRTRVERVGPRSPLREVHLPPGLSVAEAVRQYKASGTAVYVEPDYYLRPAAEVLPNDPLFLRTFGLHNTGQTGGTADADIDAPQAWATTTGTANNLIAVIDTGVDVNHPDLRGNIWTNPGEVAGNGIDDDRNGYVDDVHGWDFCNEDSSVYDAATEDAHGTHVAGTIAAVGGNGLGVAGVNWRASVMAVKFLGSEGCGLVSDAIRAIDYAVAQGARVSNNSWGGAPYSTALSDAIERAGARGHLFVAAAGNGGGDGIGDNLDVTPAYPAAYPHANLVSVAAADHDDRLASFSNYGARTVDLAAPGVSIYSTVPEDRYAYYSGTSMAAPHVAGAAALLLSQEPQLSVAAVKARLLDSADDLSGLATKTLSGGRLDLAATLAAPATSSPTPTLSPPPIPTAVATALTLGVPATLTLGQTFTLTGRLSAEGRGAVAGASVAVEQRPVGVTSWSRLHTLITDQAGAVSLQGVRPLRHTDYRLRFAGSSPQQLTPALSPTRRAHVRSKTVARVDRSNLRVGRARTVSGVVAPAHAGVVTVLVRRNGVLVARRRVTLSRSSYRLVFRPLRRGAYTFQARWGGDGDHRGSASGLTGFRAVS